ncbi:molybdate ABC transporter permease subunit [Francisellaceae bacterium]|nr:molybdate ABC transporter permease subunit [Francisellaceae bacterium]
MDWVSLGITIKLAVITTIISILIGILISLWLTASEKWYKSLVLSLLNLPLILPPTVLGFYLLLLYNPESFFGRLWLNMTGSTLSFSFSGLVIASIIYSLPFAVRPIQVAFSSVQKQAMHSASIMGANYLDRLYTVLLPLSKKGIYTSAILVFAHTIGEFGVILMVGGSIAGKTKVISISIYEEVSQMNYQAANNMSLFLIILSVSTLFIIYLLNRRSSYDIY